MISINKYGQNLDLSSIPVVNGKKSFILDNIDVNNKLQIKIPVGVSFNSSLDENDVKIEFKDTEGNVFELVLKDLAQILATNDGDDIVEISRVETNEVLASITDLNSALEAAAAGGGNTGNGNSDSGRTSDTLIDTLSFESNNYDNQSINDNEPNAGIQALSLSLNYAPTIDEIDNVTLDEDTTILIPFNAEDRNQDELVYTVSASNATVTVISGNQIEYTPFQDYNGSDQIVLNVFDGVNTTTRTIDVTVNPINDAPILDDISAVSTIEDSLTISGIITGSDVDGDDLTFATTSEIAGFTLNADGTYSFDPSNEAYQSLAQDEIQTITIPVTLSDGTETTASKNLVITVNGTNDAPEVTSVVLPSLSEDDFATLAGYENAYYVISESDVYDALGVNDVDENDGLSVSFVTGSTSFVLNGNDVTGTGNGVIQLTQTDIDTFGLTNANVGDFFIYSIAFDSMSLTDSTEVSFDVQAYDGTEYSNTGTVSVTVNGSNDAPEVTSVVLPSLSEDDFATLAGYENAYYVISESDVYDALGVNDVDENDGLSISFVTGSTSFVLNGNDVTGTGNGVIQLTQTDIDTFGLTNANVGDFFIYSIAFDSMSLTDSTEVSFDVQAYDGTEYSNTGTVSVTVNGTNDAPEVTSVVLPSLSEDDFATLAGYENAYYVISESDVYDALGVNDVDENDGLSISFVTGSTSFVLNGNDVTGTGNGVIQLTQTDIDTFGLTNANVGDFFIYSIAFDSMSLTDSTEVSFDVQAYDGTEYSNTGTVSVTVNGTNDAPEVTSDVSTETINIDPTTGSAIKFEFTTISDNEEVSFDWLFGSYDYSPFDDFAFYQLDNNNLELITSVNNEGFLDDGIYETTSLKTLKFNVSEAGTHTLIIGVSDSDDNSVESLIELSNIAAGFTLIDQVGNVTSSGNSFTVSSTGSVDLDTFIDISAGLLPSLSEDDFATLAGYENAYYVISESDVYDALGVNDVDENDGLSISFVTGSTSFVLNGNDVTGTGNGVIQLTQTDIDTFGLTNANVGDFFIYSIAFDSMSLTDSTEVSFDVQAYDGTEYSNTGTVSVTVNGTNDAPEVTSVVLPSLSEDDFATLAGYENAYYVISESDVYDALGVNDVDENDGLSISFVTGSTSFVLNGNDVTGTGNGVIQLTQTDIDTFGLTNANVGDFFIYSIAFDSMSLTDSTEVSFDVQAYDGTEYSNTGTVSVTVNGTNDAPEVTSVVLPSLSEDDFATLAGYENAYYVISESDVYDALGVNDVDENDGLSISFVTGSTSFVLNGNDVTGTGNGVIQLTQTDIDTFGLTNANVGDFFIYSIAFDSMSLTDSTEVSFDVQAYDGTEYSNTGTVSVTVNGTNDAPEVTSVVLPSLSEDDFATLAGYENAYYVISESDVYDALGVNDVDENDGLSISFVTGSTSFVLNGNDVTGTGNGVIQLTQTDIDTFGLTNANVGDFFIYSIAFDSMSLTDSTEVSFDVQAYDGTEYSNTGTVSVTVNGTNDAPEVTSVVLPSLSEDDFATLAGYENAYYVISESDVYDALGVNDVDENNGLSISFVTGSTSFVLNGNDVTGTGNGVIQLTQTDIDTFGLTNANVGDFFIYSIAFDSMSLTDSTEVSFDVQAYDGTEYSNTGTVSVTVNGVDDLSGSSIDGYISGMTVFSDLNNDEILDSNEANTLTNSKGEFSLSGDLSGITIGYGGTDVSTGIEFDGQYKSPSGISLLNPITTLIVNLMEDYTYSLSQADAEVKIYDVFGLDSSIVSLTVDPLEKAVNNEQGYLELQTVNVIIENTISQISNAIKTIETNVNDMAVYIEASKQFALIIGSTDFDNIEDIDLSVLIANTLVSIGYVDSTENLTSDEQNIISDLVEVIDNTNIALEESSTSSTDPLEALTNLTKTQVVAESIENTVEEELNNGSTSLNNSKEESSSENIAQLFESVTVSNISKAQIDNTPPEVTSVVLPSLSEDDFATLAGYENAYYVISESDVYDALGVNDVDENDGLSISFVTGSTSFVLNGNDVTGTGNGVIQLTQTDIDTFGLTNANVGDFFIYSIAFDSMSLTDSTEVSFDVQAYDGTEYSNTGTVSVTVNGTNDAPEVTSVVLPSLSEDDFATLAGYENAYYVISESDVYDALGVNDVDENDGLSISFVTGSTSFVLNGNDVTGTGNGVIQLTQTDIDTFGLTNANVGDFFIYSIAFDSMSLTDSTEVSFDVQAYDGTEYSNTGTVSVTVNGTNDAPEVTSVVLPSLSEDDFATLAGYENAYYVISESDVYDALGVNDVDENDGLSISFVTGSTSFVLNGNDVTGTGNGVIQLTQTDIDTFGLTNANVGDFFIYSIAFDSMSLTDSTEVSFDVQAYDGTEYSNTGTVSVTVNGTNDAVSPVLVASFINTQSLNSYTGLLSLESASVTYSLESQSVSVSATIDDINNLSSLANLNTPEVKAATLELQPVLLNYVQTGDLSGFLTLSQDTIATSKETYKDLRDFYNANTNLKEGFISLKDFVVANKESIINSTSLALEDIELLESFATVENLQALETLYDLINTFLDNTTGLIDSLKAITSDNIIDPIELSLIDPSILIQLEPIRLQIQSILVQNPSLQNYMDLAYVTAKLQEIITIDPQTGDMTVQVMIDSSIADNVIELDENTGEYTVISNYIDSLSNLTDIEIGFDYTTVDELDNFVGTYSASLTIDSDIENDISIVLDEEGSLFFSDENINLGNILENAPLNLEVSDIDSLDLSTSEHILSNLTIKDFEAMVSEDTSNILTIKGEDNDVIKLDLSVWEKDLNDADLNSTVEVEDDNFIAYTTTGTDSQILTLLIDKDIVVENI